MTTNVERAGIVARKVQIGSISLLSASLASDVDPLEPVEELHPRQSYRARYEIPSAHPDHIYVYVDLQFSAADQPASGSARECVDLRATFLLVYEISNAAGEPEDALRHFAELNGAYNVWPYWRELVQTVTGRVGLGAIVIPVFHPNVRRIEDGEQESLQLQDSSE